MNDARALAQHLGVKDEDALYALYASIHDEPASPALRLRFAAVLKSP